MKSIFQYILLLAASFVFFYCDNSFDPLDEETGIYAIYGVLDLNDSTNYIRIRDLNVPFTAEATESIDAEVSLEILDNAQSFTLNSEREDIEGVYEFNFLHDRPILPDETYQLSVKRSDGEEVVLTAISPTKPSPQISPLNQNCYTPIDFTIGPLNGGVIVYEIGFPLNRFYTNFLWGSKQYFFPDSVEDSSELTFSFIPHEALTRASRFYSDDDQCGDLLPTAEIAVSYTHYGPGFYEQIFDSEFDIQRTFRFGALYYDTLLIPVDTTPVCPQDCE